MPEPHDFVVPDQSGRVALVTGANSGIGYQTALRLAEAGATVLMGCRNADKAAQAEASLRAAVPGASVVVVPLDLASLDSVEAAAEAVRAGNERLDLLIDNAGVMAVPRDETAEGFELQFGTNHLGHFALTGRLLDLLTATPDSRVVAVSSNAHKMGRIRFDDLMGERRYERWTAYAQAKLANLLFALELNRRLEASGSSTRAMAAHPGWSATNLQTSGRGVTGGPWKRIYDLANRIVAQSDAMGALPTLMAATSPTAVGGGYYGPSGIGEVKGLPTQVTPSKAARDPEVARRLWTVSEELVKVSYPLPAPAVVA
jgi:NAD(P)-dependent dehydrogenase (short-subunit alcohol dehydrogenase family)